MSTLPPCLTSWIEADKASNHTTSNNDKLIEKLHKVIQAKNFYTQFNSSIDLASQTAHPTNLDDESYLDGLVSIGGKLQLGGLLEAYAKGIFPWYETAPVLWYSPFWRAVFPLSSPQDLKPLNTFKLSKSLKAELKKNPYTLTFDSAFEEVINHCAKIPRKEQLGTWLNDDMINTYSQLHHLGVAHSVEVYSQQPRRLVGGLYGVSLGKAFFGESMFSLEKNTSKIALHYLYTYLQKKKFLFIDCQLPTNHLNSLGAITIQKQDFLTLLNTSNQYPTLLQFK